MKPKLIIECQWHDFGEKKKRSWVVRRFISNNVITGALGRFDTRQQARDWKKKVEKALNDIARRNATSKGINR